MLFFKGGIKRFADMEVIIQIMMPAAKQQLILGKFSSRKRE
jgi:hypothetical protein